MALATLAAEYEILQSYALLPIAFDDITAALSLAGYVAGKVLAGWFLIFVFATWLPHILWAKEPELSSFAGAVVSASYFTLAGSPENFSYFAKLTPLAVLILGHVWIRDKDDRTRRWFLFSSPLFAMLICSWGFVALWTASFSFRRISGENPWAAAGILIAVGLALLAPLLIRAPGHAPRLVAAAAGLALLVGHGKPILRENRQVLTFEPVMVREPRIKHVILIVIDTLRADALSYRDAGAPATPNIDALAKESVIFENAISPSPWTFPAMNSLMTGIAPLKEDAGLAYQIPALPTLAEFLLDSGYHTRAISGNLRLRRPFPIMNGLLQVDTFAHRPLGDTGHAGRLGSRFPLTFVHGGSTIGLTDRAIRWARESAERPSFLWLHYLDPHDEYAPPRAYLGEDYPLSLMASDRSVDPSILRPAYHAEVRFVDDSLGRFLEALKRLGLYEDALIVLTSDHGEEFWERGATWHGHSLHQELLHVPLLIRLPGGTVRKTVSEYVPTQALLPTLLDLTDIETNHFPGWPPSLSPFFAAQGASEPRYEAPIISGAVMGGEYQWSVTLHGRKYIQRRQSGREELYDLAADPGELHPLQANNTEFVEDCRRILSEHLAFSRSLIESQGPSEHLEDEFRDRLRGLGYIE